jgi:hypothetical protein
MSSKILGKFAKKDAKRLDALLKRTAVLPTAQSGTGQVAAQQSGSTATSSSYAPRTSDG